MPNPMTIVVKETEYLRRLPRNLGGVNRGGGDRRAKNKLPHMSNFASYTYCPEAKDEDERVLGRLHPHNYNGPRETENDGERSVYPTLPKGVTVNEALTALLFHRPQMLVAVYMKAISGKRRGHIEILSGIVKDLVNRGLLSSLEARNRGDVKFFRGRAKTCSTAALIFTALAGN